MLVRLAELVNPGSAAEPHVLRLYTLHPTPYTQNTPLHLQLSYISLGALAELLRAQ